MSYSLTGKTVLITGASSGIGEACARAFAEAGARLILSARRMDRLQKLAAELKTPTHLIQLDVRDQAAVQRAIDTLPAEWQAIDILLNNAGLSRGLTKLQEYVIEDINEMVDYEREGPAVRHPRRGTGHGGAWQGGTSSISVPSPGTGPI